MTGFGRAEARGGDIMVTVEARSVNHRHLEVALRLPRTLAGLEMDARRLVQARLERGRVDVTVQVTPLPGQAAARLVLDEALALTWLERARTAQTTLGVGGEVSVSWLLERPGVVRVEEDAAEPAAPWPLLAAALGGAVDELVARRTAEGERLAAELRSLHGGLAAAVDVMAARAPRSVARREERLRERLRSLLAETAVDESRIVTEAAIWADKADVAEELTRLRAHLAELTLLLDKGGPVGRPLDFLLQELNREVNTVAAKADDLELSQAALAAKGIL
ncbi:MAG TPA: YicC/YloC family endoribonuclease, partial [Methylomirabilota bacterium]|nr:YicC/YloC family endoribonuclease [Methylomirabilota bacterium]